MGRRHCENSRSRSLKKSVAANCITISTIVAGRSYGCPVLGARLNFKNKAALAGGTARVEIGAERTKAGSVSAAVVTYLNSVDFANLAEETKRVRRHLLDRFREQFGELPLAGRTKPRIEAIVAQKKPHAALNLFKALRSVITVALRAGMIEADPTIGVHRPKVRDTGGFKTWSDEEIARFESAYPIGSLARLAFGLTLFTGQRRSDIIRMGRQHIRGGSIEVRQQKANKVLRIPLHPELQEILAAHSGQHLTFLTTPAGEAFSPGGFTNWFLRKCRAAELPGLSPHGLRKAMCRRLAEAGCSASQIAAISGHRTLREVQRYVEAADQEHMAVMAMAAIEQKASPDWKTAAPDWKTPPQTIEKK